MCPPKLLEEKPEAVRGFLRALTRAWHNTLADPAGAIEFVRRQDPHIAPKVELDRRLMAINVCMLTPDVKMLKSEGSGTPGWCAWRVPSPWWPMRLGFPLRLRRTRCSQMLSSRRLRRGCPGSEGFGSGVRPSAPRILVWGGKHGYF